MPETTPPGSPEPDAYVLGTDDEELARLGLQHELWSAAAHTAWERARIRLGMTVVDLGCGPGFASFDLARLVGVDGRVIGADLSDRFVDAVNRQARARGVTQLEARTCAADRIGRGLGLTAGSVDAIYARWLLCFVPDPSAVIREAATLLRPGGCLVCHDYFNYTSMTTAPRSDAFSRVVEATSQAWRTRGGNPDVMEHVPRFASEAGLGLEHLEVHQRLARPGSQMWQWPKTFWTNFNEVLIAMGLLSPEEAQAFHDELDALAATDHAYVVLPPVFEVIVRKPSID